MGCGILTGVFSPRPNICSGLLPGFNALPFLCNQEKQFGPEEVIQCASGTLGEKRWLLLKLCRFYVSHSLAVSDQLFIVYIFSGVI